MSVKMFFSLRFNQHLYQQTGGGGSPGGGGVRAPPPRQVRPRHHLRAPLRRDERENEGEKRDDSRERGRRHRGDAAALLVRQEGR